MQSTSTTLLIRLVSVANGALCPRAFCSSSQLLSMPYYKSHALIPATGLIVTASEARNQANQPTSSPRSMQIRRFLESVKGSVGGEQVIDLPQPSAKRISAPPFAERNFGKGRGPFSPSQPSELAGLRGTDKRDQLSRKFLSKWRLTTARPSESPTKTSR